MLCVYFRRCALYVPNVWYIVKYTKILYSPYKCMPTIKYDAFTKVSCTKALFSKTEENGKASWADSKGERERGCRSKLWTCNPMRCTLPWQMLHNMQENWIRSTSGCVKFWCYNIKYLYLYPFAMLLEVDTQIHRYGCMITARDATLSVFIQYKTLNIEQTIFHKPEEWLKLCVFLVCMDVYWWWQ